MAIMGAQVATQANGTKGDKRWVRECMQARLDKVVERTGGGTYHTSPAQKKNHGLAGNNKTMRKKRENMSEEVEKKHTHTHTHTTHGCHKSVILNMHYSYHVPILYISSIILWYASLKLVL